VITANLQQPSRDRENPPAGKDALRLWLRLLGSTNLIEQTIRNRLRLEFNTTLAKFDVLAELERTGEPQTMTALSRQLMVSNGNVTGVIDRLEKDGMVRRSNSAEDRRVQYIHLTTKGRNAFSRMAKANERWINELLSGLKKAEIRQLSEQMRMVKNSVQTTLEQTDSA
jgi:DNA-binding MarR family transcriptional regulator